MNSLPKEWEQSWAIPHSDTLDGGQIATMTPPADDRPMPTGSRARVVFTGIKPAYVHVDLAPGR